jgi:hypothetical protein
VTSDQRWPRPFGAVGLPEAVGFAIGAGAMAKALVALEANLSGNPRVRRLVRDGLRGPAHGGRGSRSDPEEQVEVPVGH